MGHPQRSRAILIISWFSITVSLLVISGWIFDIVVFKQIVPGFSPMVFNTAFSFIVFSVALLLAQYQGNKFQNTLYLIFSLSGALIGFITLLEFIFHFNAG